MRSALGRGRSHESSIVGTDHMRQTLSTGSKRPADPFTHCDNGRRRGGFKHPDPHAPEGDVVSVDLTGQRLELCSHRRTRRRSERARLARQDRVSARVAELHSIRDLLSSAVVVVSTGWVQHGWFTVDDGQGRPRRIDAHHLDELNSHPVSGGCLVGAVVHAAGGPTTVRSQLVQRTLDLLWHALHEDARQPVRWCPAPSVRMAHLRDLTRWNDAPRRTADEVSALLVSATRSAETEIERLRGSALATA
jgi:hypothetical protein